ncbi:MAG: TetR/AcrR family transcriptional regulator [Nannocystaceae bacterium]
MPTSKPSKRRRRPRQARSAATVDVLLEATTQVLLARGVAGATTNHIAARAGVSIGSLYQYFPNKQALLEELIKRHLGEMQSLIAETIAQLRGGPLAQGPGLLIEAIVAAHRVRPRLHQVFMQQMPASEMSDRLHLAIEEIVSEAFVAHPEFGSGRDPLLTARLFVRAGAGVIIETMRRAPEQLLDGKLAEAMTSMFVAYLQPASRGT